MAGSPAAGRRNARTAGRVDGSVINNSAIDNSAIDDGGRPTAVTDLDRALLGAVTDLDRALLGAHPSEPEAI